MYSDADAAALYDVLNPWDPSGWPADRFYHELVMAADSVLDVGCGTGAMVAHARETGHRGRLAGLDPDRAALERARRRADIEWIEGKAADARWEACFDLAIMTGHAFQFLVDDDDLRTSLAAIHGSLRAGGCLAFETRHPQARAWLDWNPSNRSDTTDPGGRVLRVWHEVESVCADVPASTGTVVTFTSTTADPDGPVLRVDRASLRFLDPQPLATFLAEAGFGIEAQYGDWDRGPITTGSREIITIARA
jgi:SAM-dependent methyltransferase